jgi:hypothetical protein
VVPRARVCLERGEVAVTVTRNRVGFVVPDVETVIKWGPLCRCHSAVPRALSKARVARQAGGSKEPGQLYCAATTLRYDKIENKGRDMRCPAPSIRERQPAHTHFGLSNLRHLCTLHSSNPRNCFSWFA